MGTSDADVRRNTAAALIAARDESRPTPDAAGAAAAALRALPGCQHGPALASAICTSAAPTRLAVYDRHAHQGLEHVLGFTLARNPDLYRRYMSLIEQCRRDLAAHGHTWTARRVDTALYQHGKRQVAD